MVAGKHSVSTATPGNVLFGAGTYHRGMSFDKESGTLTTGTALGATSGGGSIEIKGEIVSLELDGALVKVKGLDVLCGGTATMEASFAEVSPELAQIGIIADTEKGDKYSVVSPKAHIEEGDYVDGFGFVGMTADGKRKVAAILESALCTSGFKLEPKNKEGAVVKLTMEAVAENEGDLDTIPATIIFLD